MGANQSAAFRFAPGLVTAIAALADVGAAGPRRLGVLLGADDGGGATMVEHLLPLGVTLHDDLGDVCDAVQTVADRIKQLGAPAHIVGWVVAGCGHGMHADEPIAAVNLTLFGTAPTVVIVADADVRRASVYLLAGRSIQLLGSGALTSATATPPVLPRAARAAAIALLVAGGALLGVAAHAAGLAA
jgi:hypothetical protein